MRKATLVFLFVIWSVGLVFIGFELGQLNTQQRETTLAILPTLALLPTEPPTSFPTITPTPNTRVALPYTYEENGIQITISQIFPVTTDQLDHVPDGYHRLAINYQMVNLHNFNWSGCAGFSELRLKTNAGNIYNFTTGNFLPLCSSLIPEGVKSFVQGRVFDIRNDELPTELWAYHESPQSPTQQPDIILIINQ